MAGSQSSIDFWCPKLFCWLLAAGSPGSRVPWLLIHQRDGEALYGISNAVLTLLIFILLPYLGKIIDRTSRKKVHRWLLSFWNRKQIFFVVANDSY